MLPVDRAHRPELAAGGLTPARLRRAYRRDVARRADPATGAGWVAALDDADRASFRDLGRRLAWELIAHLDADEPESRRHHLAEATAIAAGYGRHGAELGLSMSDVVEGFLAFRRPFLAEVGAVAARRSFDPAEVAALHAETDQALDRLLVATMSAHSIRAGRNERRTDPRA